MVNISRANKNFWLRLPLIPLIFLLQLFKGRSCKNLAKKYVSGHLDLSIESRYDKFLSLFERWIFTRNCSYTFVFKKKLLQNQTIFIVDEDFDWYSIGLLRHVIVNKKHPHPRFLLNSSLLKEKPDILWDLIDTYYGIKDLERAINSKKSIFIEKSFVEKFPEALSLIKSSYIPIVPIFCRKRKESVKYLVEGAIKTSSLINFKSEALSEQLKNLFSNMKAEMEIFSEKVEKQPKKFKNFLKIR